MTNAERLRGRTEQRPAPLQVSRSLARTGQAALTTSLVGLLQTGHILSLIPSAKRFRAACRAPESAQLARFQAALRNGERAAFGREHGFASISSVRDYQRRVPIRSYAEMAPWTSRLERGLPNVLTTEPLLAFEPTSGSTRATKLIPYTQGLMNEFSSATAPWICDIFARRRKLLGTTSYWSVSAATTRDQSDVGGVRVGLEDDTEYFGPLQRWAIRKTLAVSPELGRIRDPEAFRTESSLALMQAETLGFISVWHPSFLCAALDYIDANWEALLARLPGPRSAVLRRRAQSGAPTSRVLWPKLALISCWTEGPAAQFLDELRSRCPKIELQGKGLIATEGVVSIPLHRQPHAVAAVTSHFLEFVDLQAPRAAPRLAHELRTGADYRPLLTTSGGLYRYDLGDRVRCMGHYRKAPLLAFRGRLDQRSDLCGEKLDAAWIEEVLNATYDACTMSPRFSLLAPREGHPPRYVLFVECSAQLGSPRLCELESQLESRLLDGHHYAVCRKAGQLAHVQVQTVHRGTESFRAKCLSLGMKEGDIKPVRLSRETYWWEVFTNDERGD